MPNHIRNEILDSIDSYPEFETEERGKIKLCLIAIWPSTDIKKTFNPEEIFNEYKNILENVKTRQAILNIISQFSSINDKNITPEIAATNTEKQKTELIANIQDMVIFMNRITNVLEIEKLFSSKETQKESFIFLKQLFNQLEKGLNITSSELYNNKIINYRVFINFQKVLITEGQKVQINTENIIENPNLEPEDRSFLQNFITDTKKWYLYIAMYLFTFGEDKEANNCLENIKPESANLFAQKTDIISKIENDLKRKTYVEIIEILKNIELNFTGNTNELSLETKNSLDNISEETLDKELTITLKTLEKTTQKATLILEGVKLLHLVRAKEEEDKVSVKHLESYRKIYEKLIALTEADLGPEHKSLKYAIIEKLKDQDDDLRAKIIIRNFKNNLLILSASSSNSKNQSVPAPAAPTLALVKDKNIKKTNKIKAILGNLHSTTLETKKEELSITTPIENSNNENAAAKLQEEARKEARKQARRETRKEARKEARQDTRKNEAPVDQEEKKPAEEPKNDSTKALAAQKVLEEKAKKKAAQALLEKQASEERANKEKEQALLEKQALEEKANKEKEEALLAKEVRAKKKADKKEARKQKKAEADKSAETLVVTENPKKEEQPIEKNIPSSIEETLTQYETSNSKSIKEIAEEVLKEKVVKNLEQVKLQPEPKKPATVAAPLVNTHTPFSLQKAPITTAAPSFAPKALTTAVASLKIGDTNEFPPLQSKTTIEKAPTKTIVPSSAQEVAPDLPMQKPLETSITTPTKALTSEKVSESEKELKEKQTQTQTGSTEDLQEKIRHLEIENKELKTKEERTAQAFQSLINAITALDRQPNQNNNSDLLQYTQAALQETQNAMVHNYLCAVQKQSELENFGQKYVNFAQNMQAIIAQTQHTSALDAMFWKQESEKNAYQATYWYLCYIRSVTAHSRRHAYQKQYTPAYSAKVTPENKSESSNLEFSSLSPTDVKKEKKKKSNNSSCPASSTPAPTTVNQEETKKEKPTI